MSKHKSRIIHFAVTLVFIGIGALVFVILTATKPKLERTEPPAPKPMVRVAKIKTRPQVVIIKGEGTVKPQREIQLMRARLLFAISSASPPLGDWILQKLMR